MKRSAVPALFLAAAFTLPAAAQDNVLDLRFLELNEDGHRTYHNFLYSRSFSGKRLSFESFWLFLPENDDYSELGAGVGYRLLKLRETKVSLLAYLASASDDDYFEPALLFLDADGKWTWSLFVLHYVPLGDDGVDQWLVDPFEIQYNVGGSLSVGASAYFYRPQGGRWLAKVGPKVSLSDRLGATELALRRVNEGSSLELQLRRIFFF